MTTIDLRQGTADGAVHAVGGDVGGAATPPPLHVVRLPH